MPNEMYVVITVRKPVEDAAEGEWIYNFVKERLADRPDVEVTGHVTNHFTETQE